VFTLGCTGTWERTGIAEERVQPQRDGRGPIQAELLGLHDQYAAEIRACLDFAHRSLAFYVGLLSALLVALLAGLLRADAGGLGPSHCSSARYSSCALPSSDTQH